MCSYDSGAGGPLGRRPHIWGAIAAICGIAFVIYLAFNDPAKSPAPRCWFNALTGLQCPGCGSQRAVHAILHGHIAEAWHYNAALFFALPMCAVYALSPRRMRGILYSPVTMAAIAVAGIAWFVGRNIS